MKRIEEFFVKLNGIVVGFMLFAMFVLVFTNVVTRYLFGFSMNWAEEISRYLMIWTTYLGAGLAMREGRHAAIEALQEALPRKFAPIIRACVGLFILVFLAILAYLGYNYSLFAMSHKTAVLRLPLGIIYIAIPAGALVFMLHLVLIFRDFVFKERMEEVETVELPSDTGGVQL